VDHPPRVASDPSGFRAGRAAGTAPHSASTPGRPVPGSTPAGYRPRVAKEGDAKEEGRAAAASRLPRGRHGLPRELVAENQRERLISGIIEAVAENGYADTTIAAIVKAAGLSRKTFYEHFKNKEDCFAAAYEASFGYLRQEIGAVEGTKKDWALWVRARIGRLLGLLAAEPDLASFFLIAPASVGDPFILRHHEAMRELVAALVDGAPGRRGKSEAGGTREQALAGGISRLVVRKLDDGEAAKLGELLPALSELVLRPYVGDEEAAKVAGA
jgi:AcrR family transcriptional regulator